MYSYTSPRSMTQTSHFRVSDCCWDLCSSVMPVLLLHLLIYLLKVTATLYSCTILEAVVWLLKFRFWTLLLFLLFLCISGICNCEFYLVCFCIGCRCGICYRSCRLAVFETISVTAVILMLFWKLIFQRKKRSVSSESVVRNTFY